MKILLLVLLILVSCQKKTDPPESLEAPSAAGPHTGPITVVDIEVGSREELNALDKEGFNITDYNKSIATLYVTKAQLLRLEALGYNVVVKDSQNPFETPDQKGYAGYYNYSTMTEKLKQWATEYPEFIRLKSIGKSFEGREIWALKITDNPDLEEADEPQLRFISTMHGDEPVGTELCMNFINWMLNSQSTHKGLHRLLHEAEIWWVPLLNPDGNERRSRYNAQGYDLNRSFPGGNLSEAKRPLEVKAVLNWSSQHRFVLAANFHTGAVVVNYPYDNDGKGSQYSPTPDEDYFIKISKAYSVKNPEMWGSTEFQDGITNGAAWYSVTGGLQDWSYRTLGTKEVTLEVSDIKAPHSDVLPTIWENNKESILNFSMTVLE